MRRPSIPLLPLMALLAAAPAFAAPKVYRCTGPNGQAVFQQSACRDGQPVDVKPTNTAQPVLAPPAAPETPAAPAEAVGINAESRASLAHKARLCLDWYRPRLRDPRGAYYSGASVAGTVLSFTVHTTNGAGGAVARAAACEIKGGRLDDGWTKIHAERQGW